MSVQVHLVMTPFTINSLSTPGARRRFLWFSLAYVLAWVVTWHAARVADTLGVVSLWYLPGGLRFSCLLLLGWLGLWLDLAAQLVLMLLNLASQGIPADMPWHLQVLDKLFNWLAYTFAYAAVVLPLRRRLRGPIDFTLPTHSLMFVAAALAASVLAAAAGSGGLVYQGVVAADQWMQVFSAWLIGDFIGVITLSPLLLVVVWPRIRHVVLQGRIPLVRPAGAVHAYWLTALMVLVALSLVMGLPRLFGFNRQPALITLFLLLPLVVVALHFKLRGALLAIVLLDGGLVLMVAALEPHDGAMQYQLVMAAIALVGLWLGGTAEALDRVMLRLQDFSGISNDLLWETSSSGELTIGGRLAAQLAHKPGGSWRTVLAPKSQPSLAALEQASVAREAFSNLEIAIQTRTNATLWLRVTGIPLWDVSGEFAGFRGTASDINDAVKVKELLLRYNRELLTEVSQRTAELHRSNAELAVKEQHLRVLLAAVPVGVLELDEDDRCCYLNFNGSILIDCTLEQAQGLPLLDFVHPDDQDRVQLDWSVGRQTDAVQTLEFRLRRNNIWCAAYWIKFRQTDERASRTIMVLVDSTLQHQQAEQLWGMAHTDMLTGLPNRHLFLDRCTQALTLAKRLDIGAALFWIDLDGFKSVNDTLGHAAGDAVLREVAERLLSRLRDSDTAARIGGDEFAVIMTDVSGTDNALRLATELVAALRQPYDLPQGRAQISASIGIAHYPLHASTVEALMRFADGAMYRAKHAGKDQVLEWNADSLDARDIPTQY